MLSEAITYEKELLAPLNPETRCELERIANLCEREFFTAFGLPEYDDLLDTVRGP